MDDLISRQAAIVALCKAGCDSGYCGASCDDVKAIEQLPSAQPKRTETHECVYQRTETHDWIPVTEAMPDEHNRVLVLTDDGTIFTGDHNEYWEDDYEFEIDDVVAWMPLPDPWKGE